jgi:catechol-2,3-dioxygenase
MRILELILQSKDPAAQQAFYHDLFGLPVIEQDAQHVTIHAGHTRLIFEQWTSEAPQSSYHFAFNIPENQLMQAKDWLTARTPLVIGPENEGREIYDFKSWNAHAFYFLDPDGNVVEFIARHNLDTASDAAFSENSLIGVSEISLVTPDVLQTVQGLQHNLGVEVYDGKGSDTFSAVGDENGLFIVVKAGRIGLASTWPAQPLPTQATIAGVSQDYETADGPFRIKASMTTEPR